MNKFPQILCLSAILGLGGVSPMPRTAQPVLAQGLVDISSTQAAEQVYQMLPYLPKDNTYVSRQTGQVDPNNTLISRLIRYHIAVKGRSPLSRFDWLLTLADYLGANEPFEIYQYPSGHALTQNPALADQAAIQKLDLAQRHALVRALLEVFERAARLGG